MKAWIAGAAAVLTALLLPATVLAAQTQPGDNHTDTNDYCLRAHDVTVGLLELQNMGSDAGRRSLILDAAQIEIYIRDNSAPGETWTRLSRAELSFDFSHFAAAESAEGYPVTVLAPAIREAAPSAVSFLVRVENDLPQAVLATLRFAGTALPDLTIDVSGGAVTLFTVDLPAPQREGYRFDGWYLDAAFAEPWLLGSGTAYSRQELTESLTLYPRWTPLATPSPSPSPTPTSVLQTVAASEPPVTAAPTQASTPAQAPAATPAETPQRTDGEEEPEATQPLTGGGTTVSPSVVAAACLTATLALTAAALYGSILSDLRVLRWYAKKKAARRSRQ